MKKLLALALILFTTDAAFAASVVKVPLGETSSPDVSFDGSIFGTINDGNGVTTGDQDTIINYVGMFDSLFADDFSLQSSFTLAGVTASGNATLTGTVVTQSTTGGVFSLYDKENNLLIEGELDDGLISGSTESSTGSFFNTNVAQFTGGSLLPFLAPLSAGLSFALADILSSGQPGLAVFQSFNQGLSLAAFTADASGIISGSPIPEPAAALLLLSGLLAGTTVRRRRAQS